MSAENACLGGWLHERVMLRAFDIDSALELYDISNDSWTLYSFPFRPNNTSTSGDILQIVTLASRQFGSRPQFSECRVSSSESFTSISQWLIALRLGICRTQYLEPSHSSHSLGRTQSHAHSCQCTAEFQGLSHQSQGMTTTEVVTEEAFDDFVEYLRQPSSVTATVHSSAPGEENSKYPMSSSKESLVL